MLEGMESHSTVLELFLAFKEILTGALSGRASA